MISIPTPYKIIGVAVLVISCTFAGYNHAKKIYKQQCENRMLTFQNQLKDLKIELQKEQENIKETIVVEYVDRVKTIREKEYVYVTQIETIVPSQCDLSSGWVHMHDASASGGDADTAGASDETPSGVKDNQALSVVAQNYSLCQQNAEQLRSLQEWINRTQDSIKGLQ